MVKPKATSILRTFFHNDSREMKPTKMPRRTMHIKTIKKE